MTILFIDSYRTCTYKQNHKSTDLFRSLLKEINKHESTSCFSNSCESCLLTQTRLQKLSLWLPALQLTCEETGLHLLLAQWFKLHRQLIAETKAATPSSLWSTVIVSLQKKSIVEGKGNFFLLKCKGTK